MQSMKALCFLWKKIEKGKATHPLDKDGEDSSACNVLAMQAGGPEFRHPAHTKNWERWYRPVIPALGRWRQVGP